ncbi:MAG: ComEC/Rec2 family competence protein, partial [Planctomycetota bacterium]|nr:ComEC/Rec2 family competence protein [Planctomycetota bacterium]
MNADLQAAHLPGTRLRVWGIFAAFASGLALAPHLPALDGRLWWLLAGGAGLATAATTRTRAWMLPILLSCLFMGIGWHTRTFVQAPSERFGARVALGPDGTGLVQVRGTVVQPPRPPRAPAGALARFAIQSPATRFDIAVETMNTGQSWEAAEGKAWVRVRGAVPQTPLEIGEQVELLGRFESTGPVTNPGAFDLQEYAVDRGYCGSIALSDWSLVQRLPASELPIDRFRIAAMRFIESARARAHQIVSHAAGDDPVSRALLLGLLLGEFDESQRETFEAFTRQSLVHVLSISGFHLSVMAGLALVLIRLTGERGWIEPAVVALLVVFYALLVPPQSPIVRSAALTLAMIAGELLSRRYDRLTLLGWVSLGVTIWHPSEVSSLGFQLSVGLTAALLSLT